MADSPRWLADEMLGRLARYLRFFGHDTEYVRGWADEEIHAATLRSGRVLLTRDRALAARTPGAMLLTSPYVSEQLRSIRVRFPEVSFEVSFSRCSLCNGLLEPAAVRAKQDSENGGRPPVFECVSCGHRYWEGTHTTQIRASVRRWIGEGL